MSTQPNGLGHILGQLGLSLLQGGGQALGNALQQQGNPQAFAQAQENQRQRQQLAQQLQLHQMMTPYEQAVLDQQKQAHQDVLTQQLFENQRQLASGIAGGTLDPTSTLQHLIPIPPKFTEQPFEITPQSDIGQALGITKSLNVPIDEALKYGLQFESKKSQAADKAATAQLIEQGRQQGHQEIDQMFSPSRYQQLYGKVDPDIDMYRKQFHSQLDTAAATDKKQGNTTQIDQFFKQLRDHQSPWEKEQLEQRRYQREGAEKRSDQSFQFNSGELDRERKPIEDMAGRIQRLKDTINARLPVGDPLVPAELLTVMAGGMGSGLRINEAEINRAVGGRGHFQDIKAALQKWAVDPSKALEITDAQRAQLNSLLNVVSTKISKKRDAFNSAEEELLNSNDPTQHRKTMLNLHKNLEGVDNMNVGVPDIGSPYGGTK